MKVLHFIKMAYYRLFYFFFRYGEIVDKNSSYPDNSIKFASVTGIMLLSMVVFIDLLTAFWCVSRFLVKLPTIGPWLFASIILLIFLANLTLFFRKKRYVKIVEHFRNEAENAKGFRTFLCAVFTLFSLFTISILGIRFGNP